MAANANEHTAMRVRDTGRLAGLAEEKGACCETDAGQNM